MITIAKKGLTANVVTVSPWLIFAIAGLTVSPWLIFAIAGLR